MADKIKMSASGLSAASKQFRSVAQSIDSILNTSDKNVSMLKETWLGDAQSEFMEEYDIKRKGLEQFPIMLMTYAKYFETTSKSLTSADTKAGKSMRTGKVVSASKKAAKKKESFWDEIKSSVSKGGKFYHAAKIGSSLFKVAGGVVLVGTSGVEEFFTGGAATPAAVIQAGYGVNSTANGIRDLCDCCEDKALNDKQVGETAGDILYDSGDFFTGSRGFSELVGVVSAPKYIKLGRLPYEVGRFQSKVKIAYQDVVIAGPSLLQKVNSARKIVSTVKSDVSDIIDMGKSITQPSGN
ncbi:MAG: WXG100 family type VII secretion target [Clostridium sp.]|nr:WXG100 family type VII secretion target [Clostridium sp.]